MSAKCVIMGLYSCNSWHHELPISTEKGFPVGYSLPAQTKHHSPIYIRPLTSGAEERNANKGKNARHVNSPDMLGKVRSMQSTLHKWFNGVVGWLAVAEVMG